MDLGSLIKGSGESGPDAASPAAPPAQNAMGGLLRQPQQAQGPMPPPSLDQTMAAMHYFDNLAKALKPIYDDPNLGKANMRSKVFDGIASLIADRILSLPDAMHMIKAFPAEPQEQKAAVQGLMKNLQMGRESVYTSYAQSVQGQDPAALMEGMKWSPDTHAEHMDSFTKMLKR